ncbi:hypothetical protein JHK85_001468 [Glycine max]|nr:hypothetical protein JHK87_001427 [Glycine soja]KAG5069091.1 hypothetical protein JHK85_001468 [Glycine max]KAG5088820.1 hypothetical protein JHK86_001432 [Glycine max]
MEREAASSRPSFHNYVAVMFIFSVVTRFACGLAAIDTGLGNGMNAISLVDSAYYSALGILSLLLQYYGPTFVHDASKMAISPPQYVDPYALLEDERISQIAPRLN